MGKESAISHLRCYFERLLLTQDKQSHQDEAIEATLVIQLLYPVLDPTSDCRDTLLQYRVSHAYQKSAAENIRLERRAALV